MFEQSNMQWIVCIIEKLDCIGVVMQHRWKSPSTLLIFYLNMENRSPPNFHISIYFLVFSQSIKVFVVERKCKQVMTKWNPTVKSQLTETYFCGVIRCRYLFFTEHQNKFSINTEIWIWQMDFGWVLCSFRWQRKGCSWTRLNLVPLFVETFMINFCFDDKFVYFAKKAYHCVFRNSCPRELSSLLFTN